MKYTGRKIHAGNIQGEALATAMGISFFGGVDPESGVVVERGHELEGRSIAGKVLVFPTGKGSTVGSYTLYRLRQAGKAPLAIVNAECETITAVGCIIAEIPCVDRIPIGRLYSGQTVCVDGEAGTVEVKGPPSPLPDWLRGSEPGSFAADTLSRRLPGIARTVLQEQDWPPDAAARLQALVEDMPHGWLRPVEDGDASDRQAWEHWMAPYLGQTWLQAPWFPAEVYFFRRLLEASGYDRPGPTAGRDPFRPQKLHGLASLSDGLSVVWAQQQTQRAHLEAQLEPAALDAGALQTALADLLRSVVWGNQADLSIFPAGGQQPDQHTGQAQTDHLLADEAALAAAYLVARAEQPGRVDFILDNVGMELAYDLVLADFLLRSGLAASVRFFAKPYPTYVSDATIRDVRETITTIAADGNPAIRRLGQRLQASLAEQRLLLVSGPFWISPLPCWEAPAALQHDLQQSALLISKGDANYRRWLGDRHWAFETPFQAITAYTPAPLLALRVLKAEVVAGLQPGRAAAAAALDPNWMYSGRWGVIQFTY